MKEKMEDYIEKSIKAKTRESFMEKFNNFVVKLVDVNNPSYQFQFLDSENSVYEKIVDAFNSPSGRNDLDIFAKNILINHHAIDLCGPDSNEASLRIDEILQNLNNCCNQFRQKLNDIVNNIKPNEDNKEYTINLKNLISCLSAYSDKDEELVDTNVNFRSRRQFDMGFDKYFKINQNIELLQKRVIEKKYFKTLDSGFPLLVGVILEQHYQKVKELELDDNNLNQLLINFQQKITLGTVSIADKEMLSKEYSNLNNKKQLKKMYYDKLRDACIERIASDYEFPLSLPEKEKLYSYFKNNYKNKNMETNLEYANRK